VIVFPRPGQEWNVAAEFLQKHAGVAPSMDLKLIGWVECGQLVFVVGLCGFLGKTCQIHVAARHGYHFTPRAMLKHTFAYAFGQLGCEKLIGIANSINTPSTRYIRHLGFVEEYRLKGMHEGGGDIVFSTLSKKDCRYLDMKEAA
jgi:hypothetical protein